MDKIAFIAGENFIYWNTIFYALAVVTAILLFLGFYLGKSANFAAGFAAIPVCLIFGQYAGRFVHWYCRTDSYRSFYAAMTDFSAGGYALVGIFAGCILAAAVLRLLFLHRNLPQMLDCMCLAALGGIVVGRMASFFNSTDRGQIVASIQSLPWVWPVTNTVSGATEYRLATFVIQAMVAAALLLILSVFYLTGRRRGLKDGDTTLLFLLFYGASQVVLDSTRYDSLFFRSNGFVSVVQVVCALGLALAIILLSVRMVKAMGFKWWQVLLWLLIAAGIGGAGYMEYHVQRHGDQAVFAYSVMSGCLAFVIVLTLLIRFFAVHFEKRKMYTEPLA
ncbi:MAG: prolipoprotein diacylglyceryl transferase [Eubacteriales bacterium]|nr:prolipoprotein diacylglyceryl transferase [Eubacteriales bacterium]